ncbi:aldo/keto reductase [Sandarakinorhabdus oryzae]|uniref:aldo/keto reductase n=1 Tax=Sandarakinorhabdus oryzae TaxID=2675220 RepID=UPI0012E0DAEA|nr:aldo/keto reductase [Sandarakinorhabdus oryzae]
MRMINGRAVNPVGLGCMSLSWAYGVPPAEADGIRLLHRALEIGYDHFDTSNIYGLGHNESLIAKAIKGKRDRLFLASKMGIIVDGPRRGIDCSPAAIHRCIDESLSRLETDHIDLYYLHRFDPKVPIADMIGALAELVQAGKIGSIGVSEWSAAHIREAHAVHPIAAVQTEYSPMTRNPEIAVLETCRELGITFVAFSPVGRGALANGLADPAALNERDIRRNFPRFQPDHWPHNQALIAEYNALAAANGVTPAQLSLAWVLARGPHVVAIPGTAQIAHVEENIARWDWQIPAEVMAAVDALINQSSVSGPRYGPAMQATIDTEDFA